MSPPHGHGFCGTTGDCKIKSFRLQTLFEGLSNTTEPNTKSSMEAGSSDQQHLICCHLNFPSRCPLVTLLVSWLRPPRGSDSLHWGSSIQFSGLCWGCSDIDSLIDPTWAGFEVCFFTFFPVRVSETQDPYYRSVRLEIKNSFAFWRQILG